MNTDKILAEAIAKDYEPKDNSKIVALKKLDKKANVNRSTFYLHYENTVDLLNETVRFLLDDFVAYFDVDTKNIVNRFRESPLEELNFISDEYMHPYLQYIKDNKHIFSTVLSHSDSFGFNEIFKRLYENIFDPILERFNYPSDDRKYVMMFYLNGITAIVKEWLKDGCEKSVGEVSQIIYNCIFGLKKCNMNQ